MKFDKNSFLVELVILLSLTSLSISRKRDIVLGTQHLTGICLGSIAKSMPPTFCWKKGGDIGTIPTACPNGYFRKGALCFKPCDEGFEWDGAFLCKKICEPGYSAHPLTCYYSLFNFYWRKLREVKYYTNFNENVLCPPGEYKSGALCYKDCSKIGMENCGIGACAIDKAECTTNIMKMVYDLFSGIVDVYVFIHTFGLVSIKSITEKLIRQTVKEFGYESVKKAMKTSISATKGKFAPYFKAKSIKKAKDTIQMLKENKLNDKVKNVLNLANEKMTEDQIDYLKHKVIDVTGITDNMIEVACGTAFDAIQEKLAKKEAYESAVEKMDNAAGEMEAEIALIYGAIKVLSFEDNREACKNTDAKGTIDCVRESMESISFLDTTGLVTLGSAFLHDKCDVDNPELEYDESIHTNGPPHAPNGKFLKKAEFPSKTNTQDDKGKKTSKK